MFTCHLTNHSALCHHGKWGLQKACWQVCGGWGSQEVLLEDKLQGRGSERTDLLGGLPGARWEPQGLGSSQQILPCIFTTQTVPTSPWLDPTSEIQLLRALLNTDLEDASLSLCTFLYGSGVSVPFDGVLANIYRSAS